ncbi:MULTISPECIES: pseudoazurin [unclassified Roseitalea]|uniref:pseudoazurin n=1 Tax=unclassified Roseitalea TaxID=2639107 RepID=UPI00273DBAC4|nr:MULTISPECIES: pseudoazurin [unclassified Roseitalea]
MLTRDPENPRRRNVFEPPLLVVEPGDTVRFVPVDPSHNSQSIEEMVPEGGESWRGAINEEIEVTLSTPGIYGYQCLPHYALGMVGLIFVRGEGMLDNLEQARSARHRGRAAERFEELWAAAEEEGLLSQES